MSLKHKPLDQLIEADLQELIDNKVAECKTIEYKKELPKGTDRDKKEFLYDVTSFANAVGGDLLFGIDSQDGIASSLCGLVGLDADSEKLRLESIIRDCVQPRIMGLQTQSVSLQNGNSVLIIRIPRSWNSPHMITFNQDNRFYTRNSAGKHRMDVTELRSAFLLGESLAERVRNFRLERIARIVADETPVPLKKKSRLVLHVIPFDFMESGNQIDLTKHESTFLRFPPIVNDGWGHLYSMDGFVTFTGKYEGESQSYNLFFRNGAIETATCTFYTEKENNNTIASLFYEQKVLEWLDKLGQIAPLVEIQIPVFIIMSLLNVRDFLMATSNMFDITPKHPIERDHIMLPEVLVEDFNFNPSAVMKPIFDIIWNACGYSGSRNYDQDGNWRPQR